MLRHGRGLSVPEPTTSETREDGVDEEVSRYGSNTETRQRWHLWERKWVGDRREGQRHHTTREAVSRQRRTWPGETDSEKCWIQFREWHPDLRCLCWTGLGLVQAVSVPLSNREFASLLEPVQNRSRVGHCLQGIYDWAPFRHAEPN